MREVLSTKSKSVACIAEQQMNGPELLDDIKPGASVLPFTGVPDMDNDLPATIIEYRPPPIHCLPSLLGEYVYQSSEAIGCELSLIAMPMLAAVAAAIGDSRGVLIKTGWIELPSLWTLAIAPSGAMKTPALNAAMAGTEAAQKAAYNAFQLEEAAYQAALANRQVQTDLAIGAPVAPKLRSYYVDDTTIQAVGCRLWDNPRGLLLRRDELSGWLHRCGATKDGGEAAKWLEFHAGGSLKVDRADEKKETMFVPRALVCVTGTIQPAILKKLLTGNGAQHFENGLVARFLMAMPPERVREWREAVTPDDLLKKYVDLFKKLFALNPHIDSKTGSRNPQLVGLSPGAKNLFAEFVNRNGRELGAFKDNRLKSAWSKIEAQAARLALVFHVVREACLSGSGDDAGQTIATETMEAALEWIEWCKNETRRIYFTFTNEIEIRQADRLLRFARRHDGRCTPAQAARNCSGGNTSAEVERLMQSLVAAGLAEWQMPLQPKGGRPTRYFCLL